MNRAQGHRIAAQRLLRRRYLSLRQQAHNCHRWDREGGHAKTEHTMSTGGFSMARLQRMHDVMASHVASGRMPGLVTLISRHGEIHVHAIGVKAFGSSEPMRRDTIFRVASLTKPVIAVAAMILVEEGKLRLDDPVDQLLPELKDRKVLRSLDSPLDDVVPANRPITLRDLLTFRLGYGAVMVFPDKYPIQKAMSEAGIAPSANLFTGSADELMQRFGKLPLIHQPGEKWLYNSGSDILGVLITRVSGKTLGAFLQERLFAPLGMKDTGFDVPEPKIDRLPVCYSTDFRPASASFSTRRVAASSPSRQPLSPAPAGSFQPSTTI
jgi:CubicO group peptidase (beta-lactamase class C family)